jgi:3-hydroxyisobutyrate dehydrogenase-like beta-hydroxyacid dehydrogenase
MIKQVGIIGLGKMGLPMTRHMLEKGFEVAGFDLSKERSDMAAKLGARICRNPREVAENSDVVIIIVGFDSEVMQVLNGADGLLAGARKGAIIAVASTCYEETMHEIAALAAKTGKNLGVLDMPLCRAERAAEEGNLLLLGGGDQALFDRCEKVFSAFCTDIEVLGGLGAGQIGKMINNQLLWACISANYEGLKLAAAMGVDTERLRQALLKSSGRNWALETWHIHRAMPWAEKDMTIVAHEADRFRITMPLSGVAKEVVKQIKAEKGFATPRKTS